MRRSLLLLVLLAAYTPAAAGPAAYNAGFTTRTVAGEPPFPIAVWYPTAADEMDWLSGIYPMHSAQDAPPAPGHFPLVVISHGSSGSEIGHRDWAEYLARHGYVVLVPRHVGDSYDDFSGRGSDVQLIRRPVQVTAALDAVLADPVLGIAIDPARIGMMGFSAGGYTTLKTIGGEPTFALWGAYCGSHPDDLEMCRADGGPVPAITRPGWALPPADGRVGAAVVIAPLGLLFDRAGLAGISVPVRIYRARDDSLARNEWNADNVAANLPFPAEVLTMPGDHYIFLPPCPDALATELPALCTDAPDVDRAAIHDRMAGEIATFFDQALAP